MELTLETLRANKHVLEVIATTYIPRLEHRAQFKPEFDAAILANPVKDGTVCQVILSVLESIGQTRHTFLLRYDIGPTGFVWPADGAQWAVHPYRGIVENWADVLTAMVQG